MNWEHRRDLPKALRKKEEAKAGTDLNFIAAMMAAA
jgi:hypothetical protein